MPSTGVLVLTALIEPCKRSASTAFALLIKCIRHQYYFYLQLQEQTIFVSNLPPNFAVKMSDQLAIPKSKVKFMSWVLLLGAIVSIALQVIVHVAGGIWRFEYF